LQPGLRALTDYVGASHYLLARADLVQEAGLDFVVSSDWPFDLVTNLAGTFVGGFARATELEKCMQLFQPHFAQLPDNADVPDGASRQYCSLMFNLGRSRLALMFLFDDGFILSQERLRDVGLLTAYFTSFLNCGGSKSDRDFELTDRELECLFWIAEGKTSDEIAMILGISRNTINNYITSVMRKTATKTRSEAIAFAVRNNLV
jgi:DNA-binding CsgD family transcriptional regulator